MIPPRTWGLCFTYFARTSLFANVCSPLSEYSRDAATA